MFSEISLHELCKKLRRAADGAIKEDRLILRQLGQNSARAQPHTCVILDDGFPVNK
jgi:hypothetical protein